MNRVHTLAAFAAGLIIAACVVQPANQGQSTLPNNQGYQGEGGGDGYQGQEAGNLVEGEYSCSFNSSGFQYPPFPCRVYRDNTGRKVLEKLAGSQRIRGYVDELDGGFDFDGEFYCPYGSCTQQVRAEFQSFDDGAHSGTLQTDTGPVIVSLQFMPEGFGGAAYGGGLYGGGLYGGAVYGR